MQYVFSLLCSEIRFRIQHLFYWHCIEVYASSLLDDRIVLLFNKRVHLTEEREEMLHFVDLVAFFHCLHSVKYWIIV